MNELNEIFYNVELGFEKSLGEADEAIALLPLCFLTAFEVVRDLL